MRYYPNPTNALPAGHDGGLARMSGWAIVDTTGHRTGGHTSPDDSGTVALPGGTDWYATSDDSMWWPPNLPAAPGDTFTAAIEADGSVTLRMCWLTLNGTLHANHVETIGTGRIVVTGTMPAATAGVVLMTTGATTVTVSHPLLADGPTDPGRADPIPEGAWLLRHVIPAVYQPDTPGPMQTVVDATGGMLHHPLDTLDLAARDELTDPATTPDGWIRWLATVLGVGQRTSLADTRAAVAVRAQVPAAGSAAAIRTVVRQYLTGSRACSVQATPGKPWTITIGVRADEAPGGLPAVEAKLVASGQIPAGFVVDLKVLNATWDAHDTAFQTWADLAGVSWNGYDSVGVLT